MQRAWANSSKHLGFRMKNKKERGFYLYAIIKVYNSPQVIKKVIAVTGAIGWNFFTLHTIPCTHVTGVSVSSGGQEGPPLL
jgi:hypothetical protein